MSLSSPHVAIVGATGAVGQEFCNVLRQRKFPARSYRLLASARSAGRQIDWVDGPLPVEPLTERSFEGCDLALFSAGGSISKEYAPIAVRAGCVVVDNSSAFRMDPGVPLVIPEVNPRAAKTHKGILAVPNCSTIVLAVPLWALHQVNPVRRAVVATYQAVSGAGARAMDELVHQTREILDGRPATREVFHVQCAFNVFSHNSPIGEDGYNTEESKFPSETRKIFGDPTIQITATCVRVPVLRAHTVAAAIEFTRPISETDARELLARAPGVRVVDDRAANLFPMPIEASGKDDILVGRIRRDPTVEGSRGLHLLCCGDQLRKGAALNAVQIAELLL